MLDSNFDNSLKTESKSTEKNPILLIGIGIFAWLGIGSIAFLFERILKDICFNFSVNPKFIEWVSELTSFSIQLIGILLLLKIIKTSRVSDLNIFKYSFFLLITAQVLQFIQPIINNKLRADVYLNNSSNYYEFLKENPFYNSIYVFSGLILYLVIGIIIYKNRK